MRSRNILLTGAVALLVSLSAPAAAQAAGCAGAKLHWTSGSWSGCYTKGSHGIENKTSTEIQVSGGYQATLHFRGTRPDGKPVTPPQTYKSGKHKTDMDHNNLIEIVVKKV
ncbi:hypothetical protein [Allokutzneria albata]|uniref:Uncharacterized protein n=1 Tax=Allokutzneria albata TaxID=211114 RepID=A0A1G9WYG3_ALLAB|nr:hypothetical protein [Allokutzneria albata]SDM89594.1 hypothetical protein SAMN04489726_3887 [Allokutzneria albata]